MSHDAIRARIASLKTLDAGLHDRDFLLTWEQPEAAIRFILLAAEILEDLARARVSTRVFDTGLGLSIFRDKSTRTRYAFRAGCNLLGLMTEELDESTSQIAHGETVRETATMIGFLTEVVGIRDDMYLGEGHAYMAEVAASLDESFRAGVLRQRPAVVNLQCDLDHPTQSLADLRHLAQIAGDLDALKGKKLAMSWAYSPSYGKPLSVPQGVVALMTRFGMDVVLAHPEGYDLVDEPLAAARRFAPASGGSFRIVHSMEEAFAGALAALERQALDHNARFAHWECDEAMMRLTSGGRALYMHCLPADVTGVSCARGEVSRAVFERARLDTYREASYKPLVIAAMILATRFADPAAVLSRLVDRATPRGSQ